MAVAKAPVSSRAAPPAHLSAHTRMTWGWGRISTNKMILHVHSLQILQAPPASLKEQGKSSGKYHVILWMKTSDC
ncbi:mCG147518 [Mus musculus]|nr:mCG147518 [Mus musculus]